MIRHDANGGEVLETPMASGLRQATEHDNSSGTSESSSTTDTRKLGNNEVKKFFKAIPDNKETNNIGPEFFTMHYINFINIV